MIVSCENLKMIIGEKIMELRKKQGWSQEELAYQLGISRQSVSKWESGTSIPDMERILKISEVFNVSTDFLLKENADFTESKVQDISQDDEQITVSAEEANEYIDMKFASSKKLALAVAFCVFSPVPLLVLAGLAEGKLVSENIAGGVGVAILLLIVAICVANFITYGISFRKFEYLEEKEFRLAFGVEGIVRKRMADYEGVFRTSLVSGVFLCIVSVFPLMIAAALDVTDVIYVMCTASLLLIVSVGVFLFVNAGVCKGSCQVILQEENYSVETKRNNLASKNFSGIYWCFSTAIYLGLSFLTQRWDLTWIIWPCAALLFAGLKTIVASRNKK